jgi:hypothetical protein
MGWQRFLGCLWQSFFRRHSLLRLKPAVEIFHGASSGRGGGPAFGAVRSKLLNWMRIRALNLGHRQHLDLWLPLVKLDCAGDADDFPLERGGPPDSRSF